MKIPKALCLFLSIAVAIGAGGPLQAQETAQTVVGSSGSYYTHPQAGSLHFTVGEIAVSRKVQNGLELDEGFHRGYYDLVVSVQDQVFPKTEVLVYPNPTTSLIHIKHSLKGQIKALLFNSTGQKIGLYQLDVPTFAIDMSAHPAGVYWIQLQSQDGRNSTFQIQKIQP